jgi:NAD(P)-dependent dehydrogenase (short-subunit alcohol dehydrogenase family)
MSLPNAAAPWTAAEVPDQRGRTAVVTGANTGIGFETARVLAKRGATLVLACRDVQKANDAARRIRADTPGATVTTLRLDLASLASIRQAADQLHAGYSRLDLLVNNAGLMMPPYGLTEDGFELQFGTNHLGHFALTGLVLDLLLAVPGSRVVTVSSNAHRRGQIDLGDLHWQRRRYRRVAAYGQSKLANLMFTFELQRHLAAAGAQTIAVAAHPGAARTDLMRHSRPHIRIATSRRLKMIFSWLIQDAQAGALPMLLAAVDPAASGGEYYGPGGWGEFTGFPTPVESTARSHDIDVQRRLWQESERLTGVTYQFTTQASAPAGLVSPLRVPDRLTRSEIN